ncbi:MAG: hypothetical protein M0Z75_06205 [Nitrospiraceae bacterium]|nr:hypothetical protein [Nitrospiraceae bacterium]
MTEGRVFSINISEKKGMRKKPVQSAYIRENHGIEGDAHPSPLWHRQLSLLAIESIRKTTIPVKAGESSVGAEAAHGEARAHEPGDFAENITTEGLTLTALPVGSRLRIGQCLAEVTQIGKRCHEKCEIYKETGDCIMPREGIFVKIIAGGWVRKGDPIIPL